MVAYRSENNKFTNKLNYKDLNMTLYPNTLDTRLNNVNMKGFVNIGEGQLPDYVMAEYVNAVIDGVMAIEQTLGIAPMVPIDTPATEIITTIEKMTVKDRLDRIEDGLFDERYGGTGWIYNKDRPTLNNHNHSGKNGQPPQINLTREVTDKLPKLNIDLSKNQTGLTGADIYLNPSSNLKINDALEDKLSKKNGGTILGDLELEASFQSRSKKELLASNIIRNSDGQVVFDATGTDSKSVNLSGTKLGNLAKIKVSNLIHGKYVANIRIKTNNIQNNVLFRITLGNQMKEFGGKDFSGNNTWKNLYFVFDMNEKYKTDLIIQKLNSSTDVTLSLDSVIIETIHPSVLDR